MVLNGSSYQVYSVATGVATAQGSAVPIVPLSPGGVDTFRIAAIDGAVDVGHVDGVGAVPAWDIQLTGLPFLESNLAGARNAGAGMAIGDVVVNNVEADPVSNVSITDPLPSQISYLGCAGGGACSSTRSAGVRSAAVADVGACIPGHPIAGHQRCRRSIAQHDRCQISQQQVCQAHYDNYSQHGNAPGLATGSHNADNRIPQCKYRFGSAWSWADQISRVV